MALPATGIIELRFTGSDTQCAGGFNPARGGTDYSQQDTAQVTGTVSSSTTTVTATTGIFTAAMVGNYITDGTTFKEITAFTSATVVTVDSAPTWTATTIYVGGALASPGKVSSVVVAGNTVYQKYNASPYLISAGTSNTAGNKIDIGVAGLGGGAPLSWVGYDVTRTLTNTDANRPTLQANANSIGTLFQTNTGGNSYVRNLICDSNRANFTGNNGFSFRAAQVWYCKQKSSGNSNAIAQGNNSILFYCESADNAVGANALWTINGGACIGCYSHDQVSGTGAFVPQNSCLMVDCIAYNNAAMPGFLVSLGNSGHLQSLMNCTSSNNAQDGFSYSGTGISAAVLQNCLAVSNGGFGFKSANATPNGLVLQNCASYNNTSGRGSNIGIDLNAVTLTANPLNSAGTDFGLNSTAGGGAACRAAGIPGAFPGLPSTIGYLDIGAVQHKDSGSSPNRGVLTGSGF